MHLCVCEILSCRLKQFITQLIMAVNLQGEAKKPGPLFFTGEAKKPGPLFFTAHIFKMPAPICVICWRTSMSVNQIYTKIGATWQRSETPMLPLTTPVLRHEALCHNDIQTRGISEW